MRGRLSRLLRRVRPIHLSENDLDEEIRFHLDCRTADLVEAGMAPDEAARRARLEFGATGRMKEACRDQRTPRALRDLGSDVRAAWRRIRRDRGLSATIVVSMTLATGVTATVFAVAQTVLLRPLPYREPERLVLLWNVNPQAGLGVPEARETASSVFNGDFRAWRDQSGLFEGLTAVAVQGIAHLGRAERLTFADADPNAEPATVAYVTPDFFQVFGVTPRLGRPFDAHESAVILLEGYWRQRFEADEQMVGQRVWQGYGDGPPWQRELLLAGVMPREFVVLSRAVDYLEPFRDFEAFLERHPDWRANFAVVGRLKRGVSLEAARRRAHEFSRTLESRNPGRQRGWRVELVSMTEDASGQFRAFLLAVAAAAGVLVVVLGVNTSTLLLLRGVHRRKETALRTALGATRGRLIRQFLTESTLLALAGAAAGLLVANVLLAWLRLSLPNRRTWGASLLQGESLRVDAWVVLFVVFLAGLVGLLFGLLPAWQGSRADMAADLKDAGPAVTGPGGRSRLRAALVASQFVLGALLLTGSGLLIRSGLALWSVGPGFTVDSRVMVGVRPSEGYLQRVIQASGRTAEEATAAIKSSDGSYWLARERFRTDLLERAASLPGVRGVTSASAPVMAGRAWLARFSPDDRLDATAPVSAEALFTSVDPNYFSELDIPVREGRAFTTEDRHDTQLVAVVSTDLARRLWPGESPLGRTVQGVNQPGTPRYTVVGVVGSTRAYGMEREPVPHVYQPWSQNRWWHGRTAVFVRSGGDPMLVVQPLRRAATEIDPDATILGIHRVGEIVRDSAWRLTQATRMSATLAGIALLLAAIGVYGVLSHSVRARTREIGLRVALGARRRHIVRMVLGPVMLAVVLGVCGGLAASIAVVQSLRALLFGVDPLDPAVFAAAAVVLTGSALLAGLLPLRRALALEPLRALRHE